MSKERISRHIINKEVQDADVIIVGGGASGLAAAVELRMSSAELDVLVIEKNDEPGRKIRATGSGRCNITNTSADGYIEIMEFFSRIGLVTRAYENGLVYPYSESAADVAALLTERADELGVRIITGAEATSVSRDHDGAFHVEYKTTLQGGRPVSVKARGGSVILALGGKAGPTYGTTGDGYRLARELGHSIVTPVPVLTSVECEEWNDGKPDASVLAGTRTRGVVSLYKSSIPDEDSKLFEESGEIQFTRYGLSGICVFNMTRHMRYNRAAGETIGSFCITADLFPDGNIEEYLKERRKNAFAGEKTCGVLRTVLKENIAGYVIERAGSLGDKPVGDLTDADIRAIGDAVHRLGFRPSGIRGWKEAQATSGGVRTDEIDPLTCESSIVPGLYITGELADRDFPCGGFNLSNAWITGLAAARSIISKTR